MVVIDNVSKRANDTSVTRNLALTTIEPKAKATIKGKECIAFNSKGKKHVFLNAIRSRQLLKRLKLI